MEEKFFYQDKMVWVSNTRVIINNTTYALSNISSVSTYKQSAKVGCAALLFILGGFFFIGGVGAIFDKRSTIDINALIILICIGISVLAAAIIKFTTGKGKYAVRITSSSGIFDALYSKDYNYINNIVIAINKAIIERG